MDPYISIIIPVFSFNDDIDYCLESVFNTTYPHFECIVVDDHSPNDMHQQLQRFPVKVVRMSKQMGPAFARNRGVEAAKGDVLLFVDADVQIHPGTLEKVVRFFNEHPGTAACFGSYDDQLSAPNFISQYKNLLHHYIHQTSSGEATTFWSGLGAIRKNIFIKVGGFNENYRLPSIEDIELGYRLLKAGYQISLVKSLQATHRKRWTFFNLLRTDIFLRAIPWTKHSLAYQHLPKNLNFKTSARWSSALVMLAVMLLLCGVSYYPLLAPLPVLILLLLILNLRIYLFFNRKRGLWFMIRAIPMHWLYYFYSGVVFVIVSLIHWAKRAREKIDVDFDRPLNPKA